ncbi:MAG: hypothetical protein ACOVN4_11330 [Bosea sp. (in: a-proteobacteria)]|jgi:uncharacterized membrane protein YraQ (UPF0718 family)
MILIGLTIILYALVAWLMLTAWQRRDGTLGLSLQAATREILHLLPRLALGVIGSGFIAKALPQDQIVGFFGSGSGILGVALAALAGALTPGGPVVGFALGAAALKAGAGLPQVMSFVTGWSLYTLNRMLIWELPFMPSWFVRLRILVSLPFPFITAGLVYLALQWR